MERVRYIYALFLRSFAKSMIKGVVMPHTMDTEGVPLETLRRLKDESKHLLYVGRNEIYTDLGYYRVNMKGRPIKSPAAIERIGASSEFAALLGSKREDELSKQFPSGVLKYFTDIPKYEDGSAVPNGRYELEIIEVTPPIIRGKIEGKEVSMDIVEGKPEK